MDTIKILLGATVAVLLGALAMSWKNFKTEEKSAPDAELKKIETQIAEIRLEQERLRLERMRLLGGAELPVEPEAKPANPQDIPETGATYTDDTVAGGTTPPDALPPPPADMPPAAAGDTAAPAEESPAPLANETQRADAIKGAPVVAKVGEWVEDGAFAVVQVVDATVVKSGAILCVRRNSGILGRLKVGDVEGTEAVASATAAFPGPKPQAGDELIVEP
ncbi:hypothetical protein [Luteolibacter luteus]|uniref:Uncharacterized protein n=1 Tax=Luteolibacter luteus TaxID=2728835 RepID=A0A858RI50_9BACT|nr:hypothetical protein [Luteolibacter luteus]QJE96261.1 hypothetical protein HHL09_10855 [Luteolibacter luteus]